MCAQILLSLNLGQNSKILSRTLLNNNMLQAYSSFGKLNNNEHPYFRFSTLFQLQIFQRKRPLPTYLLILLGLG